MNQYHWLPSQWAGLDRHEKALIIAGIDIRVTEENKQRKEQEKKARANRH